MKFRGDYTVVGKMSSNEVLSPKATIDEIVDYIKENSIVRESDSEIGRR